MTRTHTTIHGLVASWAERTPHANAVVCNGIALTYAELNAKAECLAHTLRGAGVATETTVGLCADRSIDMIVGMLGILKAGAAYVPLSPALPADRLAFMLEDSGAAVLVTEPRLVDRLPPHALIVIDLEDEGNDRPVAAVGRATHPCPDNLAYLIYTSGSTGRPKGTAITHRTSAIYPATIVGVPPMEDFYIGGASVKLFLPIFKMNFPEIVDIALPA